MNINEQNIDQILTAYLLNELDVEAKKEVEQWMKASSENKSKFDTIREIWENAEEGSSPDVDAAWRKVDSRIKDSVFRPNQLLKIAASIIFLAISSFVLYNVWSSSEGEILYAQSETLQDTLVDGSIITLNTNSTILLDGAFNNRDRSVRLEGEAFFDIERNPEKPFIIQMEDCAVEVLGTSFNIKSNAEDSLISVAVSSGLVAFEYTDRTNKKRTSRLSKNHKLVYNKLTKEVVISEKNILNQADLYWINESLVFEGHALTEVAQNLEAIFEKEVLIEDSSTKNCLLTASFEKENIEQILEVILSTFDLELSSTNEGYILKGKACETN